MLVLIHGMVEFGRPNLDSGRGNLDFGWPSRRYFESNARLGCEPFRLHGSHRLAFRRWVVGQQHVAYVAEIVRPAGEWQLWLPLRSLQR